MTKKEFILECHNRGICRKSRAIKYTEDKPKDYDYTDKDFENVFSFDDIITNGDRLWASYVDGDDTSRVSSYQPKYDDHTQINRKEG